MSPTVLRHGPFRFFFYSNEAGEPSHIHVQEGRKLAKFWLQPVRLAKSTGFASHELNRIESLVAEHESRFLEAWNDFFGSTSEPPSDLG